MRDPPHEDPVLALQLNSDLDQQGVLSVTHVQVKRGPRAWKTASLFRYGDDDTGEITNEKLTVKTWIRKSDNDSYNFEEQPKHTWTCEGAEIEAVLALITAELPHDGTFYFAPDRASALLARTLASEGDTAVAVVSELLQKPGVRAALVGSDAVSSATALLTHQSRSAALDRLEAAALDPASSENDLQKALEGQWWLFGGQYIGEAGRRSFLVLDQLDIPLLRADGSLHVVELKRAQIPALIKKYRNHYIVGSEVHEAVGQAMNYLRSFDESSPLISQDFGVDVRRSSATVVIGHSGFVSGEVSRKDVSTTLRTYNSHLSRVQVITFDDLIDGARAALKASDLAENPELT